MLAVSGELDRRRAGPHPFPPIEQWAWTQHNPFKAVYPTEQRTVFLMTQRLVKHPYLAIFDGPDTNTSTDVRPRSTVPLQALFLMNNPFVQEPGRGAGPEGLRRTRPTATGRLERAWELAWSPPADALRSASRLAAISIGMRTPSAADRRAFGLARARSLDQPVQGPPDRQ